MIDVKVCMKKVSQICQVYRLKGNLKMCCLWYASGVGRCKKTLFCNRVLVIPEIPLIVVTPITYSILLHNYPSTMRSFIDKITYHQHTSTILFTIRIFLLFTKPYKFQYKNIYLSSILSHKRFLNCLNLHKNLSAFIFNTYCTFFCST